jgi:hypothetical protein
MYAKASPGGSQIKDLLSDSLRSLARKFPLKTWSQGIFLGRKSEICSAKTALTERSASAEGEPAGSPRPCPPFRAFR